MQNGDTSSATAGRAVRFDTAAASSTRGRNGTEAARGATSARRAVRIGTASTAAATSSTRGAVRNGTAGAAAAAASSSVQRAVRIGTASTTSATSSTRGVVRNDTAAAAAHQPEIDLSEDEVLCMGLEFVGFTKKRQKVKASRNTERFRGNYGVSPLTVSKLIRDLQTLLDEEHRIKKLNLNYLFLTLHWLKAYPTYIQLEGPWNVCPETIGATVKLYTKAIQRLKEHKIKWFEEGEIDEDEINLITVDGVHCRTFEVRKDPSTKWYSHKSHSAGLAYELAIAI